MVAMIMLRALHKDIQFYNSEQAAEDPLSDETGWKTVHGDIFRKPMCSNLFSILAGSGVQIIGVSIISLLFSVLGFISLTIRGALMTIMFLLFIFMGLFSGYTTLRLYKMFDGENWKTITLLSAILVPGVIFSIFLFINFVIWVSSDSTLAVSFLNILLIFLLWFGISLPLIYLGAYFGFSAEKITNPCEVHRIPRQIPSQVWYMRPIFTIFMGGVLPFGAVFIELYFIMTSIWLHRFYVLFTFIFVVFFILILTCAEITIVLIYFQLCNADYKWWWRSFLTSGSSSFYLFLYAAFYYFTKLKAGSAFTMALVYFGYMGIISYFFFMLTGAVGFFSSFFFIRRIYGSIKVD